MSQTVQTMQAPGQPVYQTYSDSRIPPPNAPAQRQSSNRNRTRKSPDTSPQPDDKQRGCCSKCWHGCTHRQSFLCGCSLRFGIFFIAAMQLLVCILTIVSIVQDDRATFATGTAIVCGTLAVLLFFGAKYRSIIFMWLAIIVAAFNIFLSIASLIALFVDREEDANGDKESITLFAVIMEFISTLASITAFFMAFSYKNFLKDEKNKSSARAGNRV